MKTRSLLPLSCFVSASLLAQVQPDTVSIGTKADGTELRAVAYPLPQRAETFSMSEKGRLPLHQLPRNDQEREVSAKQR